MEWTEKPFNTFALVVFHMGRPRKYHTEDDARVAKSLANRKAYQK
jgi:hypothetical protein